MTDSDELWIFAYGSLMWRPGFDYQERQTARLHGFHRALCIYSHIYRGTPERPGLVMGLDRGGSCHGVAFRVSVESAPATLEYLRARELITNAYTERRLPVRLPSGRMVRALAYVAERGHTQYAGRLSPEALLTLYARALAKPDQTSIMSVRPTCICVVSALMTHTCAGCITPSRRMWDNPRAPENHVPAAQALLVGAFDRRTCPESTNAPSRMPGAAEQLPHEREDCASIEWVQFLLPIHTPHIRRPVTALMRRRQSCGECQAPGYSSRA